MQQHPPARKEKVVIAFANQKEVMEHDLSIAFCHLFCLRESNLLSTIPVLTKPV